VRTTLHKIIIGDSRNMTEVADESFCLINTHSIYGQVILEMTMDDEYLPGYIKENYEVYGRFTFDYLFKRLLADGYDYEEAKDTILYNCALSTLTMQERIYNEYYLEMSVDDSWSPDLLAMYREEFNKAVFNEN
jgi:hypothetical protein